MSLRNRALACFAVALTAPTLHAQGKPEDLRASVASALNRIHLYDNGAAWHITIHAQLVDQGRPGDSGTVDLYRNQAGELRTVFIFPNFHQTRYTAAETLIEGDAGDPPAGLENFIGFFNTSEHLSKLPDANLHAFDIKRRTITFHCTRATEPGSGIGPTYCTLGHSAVLRYNTLGGSYVTLFEHVTTFENGDVPTQATIFFQYQPIARLTLEYAPLSASEASVHPAASAAVATTLPDDLNAALNHKLIDPFVHPSPTLIAPPDNGAALLRVEIHDGRVEHIEVLAASDSTTAKDVSAGVRSFLTTAHLPPGRLFVNYPYTLYLLRKNADANAEVPDLSSSAN